MSELRPSRLAARLVALLLAVFLAGCETLSFYHQAAVGQWRVIRAREPIDTLLRDDALDSQLREQLLLVQAVRRYAEVDLGLPVGDAYSDFAQLETEYPIWNVFAAPELGLEPHLWCYPIVGCLSYRGYFARADAEQTAGKLRADAMDVYVAPVAAYSTLGWFDDPVMSSFVKWPPEQLAQLLFHELAHRQLYLSGDTAFNESYATAVSFLAVEDWIAAEGKHYLPKANDAYRWRENLLRGRAISQLLMATRAELEEWYRAPLAKEAMRAGKREVLAQLQTCYDEMAAGWPNPRQYSDYIARVNNAALAGAADYSQWVEAFVAIRQQSASWQAFYAEVERIGEQPKKARDAYLRSIAKANPAEDSTTQVSSMKVTGPSFSSETCMSAAKRPLATLSH
ncbi:aminopeptidase [Biformimicrobium ophioploci]|uniref:Aminopeptidase n=1 Tax=Biformimicrobium ophioploci TaxID=3036711 RepID=A0ABQ6LVX7_9GAMM|nr:aminopeptidase [Microbulbifer sp. NKW57]GMG86221.1 aminopeptidase [Microbulbifer sp. NKW57]